MSWDKFIDIVQQLLIGGLLLLIGFMLGLVAAGPVSP